MMGNSAKIYLSEQELQLMCDAGFILTKRRIIDAVCSSFAALSVEMQQIISDVMAGLPETITTSSVKISKGENYRMLPYVMLDYPRVFTGADIFAIRTLFWWGNFFSITLHLSGMYQSMFEKNIAAAVSKNSGPGIFICINKDQWQHHFEPGNYLPAVQFSQQQILEYGRENGFMKLAIKFPLQQPGDAAHLLEKSFKDLVELLIA